MPTLVLLFYGYSSFYLFSFPVFFYESCVFWSPNLLMVEFLLSYAALDRLGYKDLLSPSNKALLKLSYKALIEIELRCSLETELLHGSLKLSYKAP